MAATYFTTPTTYGFNQIALAIASNTPLNLSEMSVGDGNGSPVTPDVNQTALVRERYRASINSLERDPANPNYVYAELVIPATVGGWTVREVGVWDAAGNLFAVANHPDTYKPLLPEGSTKDLAIRVILEVASAATVNLIIDPSIVLASRSWVAGFAAPASALRGGTNQQLLRKRSNLDFDFEWISPLDSFTVNVNTVEEHQVLAAGQTLVDFTTVTTNGLALFIDGKRLQSDEWAINSSTQVALAVSYPDGSKLIGVQNEQAGALIDPLNASLNLSDVASPATALANLGGMAKGYRGWGGATIASTFAGDVNSLTEGGFYSVTAAATNLPIAGASGVLMHMPSDTVGGAVQTFVPLTVSPQRSFTRYKVASVWSSWQELVPGSHLTGMVAAMATETAPVGWVKCNGAALTRSAYPELFAVLTRTMTATVTTGTPGTLNVATHGLGVGACVSFETAGTLPTGITAGTNYYVVSSGYTTNTFRVATSRGGSAINLSTAGSGGLTVRYNPWGIASASTFNVPDLRAEFIRGLDDGRGIDIGRVMAMLELDAFQGHWHSAPRVATGSGVDGITGGPTAPATPSGPLTMRDAITDGTNGTPRVASETRPRNVAMPYMIHY